MINVGIMQAKKQTIDSDTRAHLRNESSWNYCSSSDRQNVYIANYRGERWDFEVDTRNNRLLKFRL